MLVEAIKDLGIDRLKAIRDKWHHLNEFVKNTPVENLNLEFEYIDTDPFDYTDRYLWDECGATFCISTNNADTGETWLSENIILDIDKHYTEDAYISEIEEFIEGK